MHIWPAIDLRGGKCVRLQQGDYGRETVFGDDPAEMACRWVWQGARRLHLVDLDGARDGGAASQGGRANREAVRAIVAAVDVPCQLGGGIRDESTIEELLELGLSRLVIGTRALSEPAWFRQMCRRHPGKLAAGIDARGGMVATHGWLETSSMPAVELARQLAGPELGAIVYTDIAKDGMLQGPNFAALEEMRRAIDCPLVASGGVTTAEDVRRLAASRLDGAIVGRTLYDGKLSLADALTAAGEADRPTS